jgi:hypothetical protein
MDGASQWGQRCVNISSHLLFRSATVRLNLMFVLEFALLPPPQAAPCVTMQEKWNTLAAQRHLLLHLAIWYSLPTDWSSLFINLI